MGKKIIIVTGSPHRQGNTNTVVSWVAEGAREHDAQVDVVDVTTLNYKVAGCTGCMGCKSKEGYSCIIQDDIAKLAGRLPEYDVVILSSPVYFFSWTAQLKILIDRMFCLFRFENDKETTALENVQLGVIATAGGGMDDGLGLLDKSIDMIASIIKLPAKKFYVATAPEDVNQLLMNGELRDKALNFGAELAG